jgi:transposase-like protein
VPVVVSSKSTFLAEAIIMETVHSDAFIEQALIKVYSRGNQTIQSVADGLHVSFHQLSYWMKRSAKKQRNAVPQQEKRPADWTTEEQLIALHETHGLSGQALQVWCREHGLFAHHLTSWKTAFCADGREMPSGKVELRQLKDEVSRLKREAIRKDRALAEAAALLILQKKFQALWEDEGK